MDGKTLYRNTFTIAHWFVMTLRAHITFSINIINSQNRNLSNTSVSEKDMGNRRSKVKDKSQFLWPLTSTNSFNIQFTSDNEEIKEQFLVNLNDLPSFLLLCNKKIGFLFVVEKFNLVSKPTSEFHGSSQ